MHWGVVRGACVAGHLVQGRVDLFLRSVAVYLGLALVFVWGGARRGGFNLSFEGFLLVLVGLSFWRGGKGGAGVGAGLSFYVLWTIS